MAVEMFPHIDPRDSFFPWTADHWTGAIGVAAKAGGAGVFGVSLPAAAAPLLCPDPSLRVMCPCTQDQHTHESVQSHDVDNSFHSQTWRTSTTQHQQQQQQQPLAPCQIHEALAMERTFVLHNAQQHARALVHDAEQRVEELKNKAQSERELLTKWKRSIADSRERVGEQGSNIVYLNVGGTLCQTTKTTLRAVSGSLLDAMFSGMFELPLDREGQVFIDRDGPVFAHVILPLLRSLSTTGEGSVAAATYFANLPADIHMTVSEWHERVRHELAYFGLTSATPFDGLAESSSSCSLSSSSPSAPASPFGPSSQFLFSHPPNQVFESVVTTPVLLDSAAPVRLPTPSGFVYQSYTGGV